MIRPGPTPSISFTAHVVRGAGRGRTIGSPTLNLSLPDVPCSLRNGIYACTVSWNRHAFPAAMHFGPRPVFNDSATCEVHVIGRAVRRSPLRIRVEVLKRLRSIRNFKTVTLLRKQIARDVKNARDLYRHR